MGKKCRNGNVGGDRGRGVRRLEELTDSSPAGAHGRRPLSETPSRPCSYKRSRGKVRRTENSTPSRPGLPTRRCRRGIRPGRRCPRPSSAQPFPEITREPLRYSAFRTGVPSAVECFARSPNESRRRNAARSLRDPRAARRRRNGRGLSRTRREARPRGRHQGAAGAPLVECRRSGPVRARGKSGRVAVPPEHPRHPRLRKPGRCRLRRHGAPRRGNAAREARVRDLIRKGRGRARAADCPGTLRRARKGRGPPRPETGERLRRPGRPRQDPRLRPGQADGAGLDGRADERADGLRADGAGNGDGHGRLHVARAGARASARPPVRHLLVRSDPVRASVGKEGLPAGHGRGHDVGGPEGRPCRSCRAPGETFRRRSSG